LLYDTCTAASHNTCFVLTQSHTIIRSLEIKKEKLLIGDFKLGTSRCVLNIDRNLVKRAKQFNNFTSIPPGDAEGRRTRLYTGCISYAHNRLEC
jgi:hypothetical protein